MRTPDRRRLTSPLNARKSRGPITPEGKARSAAGHNLRHGLLARNIVLDEESAPRFAALAQQFQTQLQPRDLVEHNLVESLTHIRWRQFRVWNAERTTISEEMHKQAPALLDTTRTIRAAYAFRTLAEKSHTLDLIGRYDGRLERQFTRTLNHYLQLRARETVNLLFDPNSTDPTSTNQDTSAPETPPKPS